MLGVEPQTLETRTFLGCRVGHYNLDGKYGMRTRRRSIEVRSSNRAMARSTSMVLKILISVAKKGR